jgi:hypothetical protein
MERDDGIPMSQADQPEAMQTSKKVTYPVAYELELYRVIELAAYYLAENDGFRRSPPDYWLAAEQSCRY